MDGYSKVVLLVCFLITTTLFVVLKKKRLLNVLYTLALSISFIVSFFISLIFPFSVGVFSDMLAVDLFIAILLVILFYVTVVFIFVVIISSILPRDFIKRVENAYVKYQERRNELKIKKSKIEEEKLEEEKIEEKEGENQLINKYEKIDNINQVVGTENKEDIENSYIIQKKDAVNKNKRKHKKNRKNIKNRSKNEKDNKIIKNNVDINENIDKMSIGEQNEVILSERDLVTDVTEHLKQSIDESFIIKETENRQAIDVSFIQAEEEVAVTETSLLGVEESAIEQDIEIEDVIASRQEETIHDVYPADWYVNKAFDYKVEGDLPAAINCYMKGLDAKPDKELVFMVVLDICVIYKQLGQPELAKEILSVYIEKYGDIMSEEVRCQIEQNLA